MDRMNVNRDIEVEDLQEADHPRHHRPFFRPLFTKIFDSTTNIHHQPSVHYVFASDPTESSPILDAALSLQKSSSRLDTAEDSAHGSTEGSHGQDNEVFVVIDMDRTGTRVLSARSMSPSWIVSKAFTCPAPNLDDECHTSTTSKQQVHPEIITRNLDCDDDPMLLIEGMKNIRVSESIVEDDSVPQLLKVEALVEEYGKQMQRLKLIMHDETIS